MLPYGAPVCVRAERLRQPCEEGLGAVHLAGDDGPAGAMREWPDLRAGSGTAANGGEAARRLPRSWRTMDR